MRHSMAAGGAMEIETIYDEKTNENLYRRVMTTAKQSSINHYFEMGLIRDKTSLITRICNELNFTLNEKKKSTLTTKKTLAKSKSSIKKRQTLARNTIDDEFGIEIKQFEVEQMPLEPYFRYVPDRYVM